MNTVYIQADDKQLLGAKIAEFAIRKFHKEPDIAVRIINIDKLEIFKKFSGKEYLRSGKKIIHNPADLQSFTLSRFMAPELSNFEGRTIVIDPDIFALCDINELFSLDLKGHAIGACSKKSFHDSSVMLLDCAKLKDWNIEKILHDLVNKKIDYHDLMTLQYDIDKILEIPRVWNDLDHLTPQTKLLHTTMRLTQPWKTGLKIDFTRNKMRKIFGIIPREPIYTILGKYPTHYQEHPDKNIINLFFNLTKEALNENFISLEDVKEEINKGNIRSDFIKQIK